MENTQYTDSGDALIAQGVSHVAYIRQVDTGYGVFAADGTQLAVFESRDAAYYTARQHNLEPLSIH